MPPDHAPVTLSEYYPELPDNRTATPLATREKCCQKCVAYRNTYRNIPPLHDLPPAGGCQTPLTERSSTLPVQSVLRNGIRIENIRPASLSITATLLKVTHRLPDGKLPKGTIRLKEDRVFVVDDRMFHR